MTEQTSAGSSSLTPCQPPGVLVESSCCPAHYLAASLFCAAPIIRNRLCNFRMKFRDREIAREIKFPDRESREKGKILFTSLELLFLPDEKLF